MSVHRQAPCLLHVFSTFEAGGAQARFVALANHFGSALRHVVVAMDGKYGFSDRLAPGLGVEFRRVAVKRGYIFANRRVFRALIRELSPDILVTHNWATIEWAMANLPRLARHIHIVDGFGPDEAETQLRRRVWTRRAVLPGSTVIVPSHTLERIVRDIWRLPAKEVLYIPNGIDCARFDAAFDSDRVRSWPGTGPVIGTVAVLRAEKNLARLVRAFTLLAPEPRSRLVILGEGPERPRLQALAAELGLGDRVFLAGHVAEPHRFYGAFDIFALTSDTEQMPYTVLEAMAAGRPVVATDVGDIRRMVVPDNQPYIVARDETAIAGAIGRLLADEALRQRIGRANREKARREYDQKSMFETFAKLYGLS